MVVIHDVKDVHSICHMKKPRAHMTSKKDFHLILICTETYISSFSLFFLSIGQTYIVASTEQ
jgi:hypothetical protein